MLVQSINKIFELELKELTSWDIKPHKHDFFVITYIEQGAGVQCINHHKHEYQAGHISLLPPFNCHSFDINEPSRLYFIRFTDLYFLKGDNQCDYKAWYESLNYILANYNNTPGDLILSANERRFIINNIKAICQEQVAPDNFSKPIIIGAVASILNVLARSIERTYVEQANQVHRSFGEIVRYINTHLTTPEKLRLPALACRFSISKTYFSAYFKKQAGRSLANYILQSKLKLAETKLLHTDLSLKEIAYQLNFTDSSHLSNSFKKVYGLTINEFRKKSRLSHT